MKNFCLFLFPVLLLANLFIYKEIFAPHLVQIFVLDVGKGSATLIRTPNRKTVLLETGSDVSILRALGTALPPWQRRIDAIILIGSATSVTGGLSELTNHYHAPTPLRFGTVAASYGARIIFDNVSIEVSSLGVLTIFYGKTFLTVSSTTPKGAYHLNGGADYKN